jgi:hypothetical protein
LLLSGHGNAEALLGVDEVVEIIVAKINLHPVDLASEPAAMCVVVGRNGGARLVSDVGSLVG